MGMGENDTDTIGHDKLGILGTSCISKQKIINWDSCPNVASQIITFAQCSRAQTNLIALS